MSKRVLISVYDKTGISDFARGLVEHDYEILSTGGTARVLKENGLEVIDVSEVTEFPEMMDGRVKTLHPAIHAGLLALRNNKNHMQKLTDMGIEPIDMVVVNLYPFKETISKPDVTLAEAIENIDIGGPTMLRSAAKNYEGVTVVTDPADYDFVLGELEKNRGKISNKIRRKLAVKVFQLTSEYDSLIYNYLHEEDVLPEKFNKVLAKKMDLRYGENPHQKAAFYEDGSVTEPSVTSAEKLYGKELSFNNINDTDGALEIVKEFAQPAVAVIKHTNPCGLAVADDLLAAYRRAYAGDPVSAYGSIVALNRKVDVLTAEEIAGPDKFVEVVIAPDYEEEALTVLQERWKNVRILKTGKLDGKFRKDMYEYKKVTGGLLVQERNLATYDQEKLKVVSQNKPDDKLMEELLFAWKAVKHVKSNAIVISKDKALAGVGAGQMSRVDAMIIAARKAGEKTKGAVVASDAFFPFRDAVDEAAKNGIKAIIQPGGSIRDEEVIEAVNELGMTMVFTGYRHFKH